MPIQLGRGATIRKDRKINRVFGLGRGLPAFGYDYIESILALFGSSIVSYLPLSELGGTVAEDVSKNGYNGAYTAVTLNNQGIGDGQSAASFDGSASFCDWYSTGLATAFNSAEGTLIAWVKVANVGVWTDGTITRFVSVRADGNNIISITKDANNRINLDYTAGATSDGVLISNLTEIGWMNFGITWSVSLGQVKCFYQGNQNGTTQTGLGTWVGALASNLNTIGAANTTPTNVWSGLLAHAILLNRAATAAEIAEVYQRAF